MRVGGGEVHNGACVHNLRLFFNRLRNESNAVRLPTRDNREVAPTKRRRKRLRSSQEVEMNPSSFPKKHLRPTIKKKKKGQQRDVARVSSSESSFESQSDDEYVIYLKQLPPGCPSFNLNFRLLGIHCLLSVFKLIAAG